MNIKKKNELVELVKEMMESSSAIYFLDFNGMNVENINELRNEFYKVGLKYKVVKNTLISRAITSSGKYSPFLDVLKDYLKGQTGIVFAYDDTIIPAKIIKKFFDKNEKPVLKAAVVDNNIYDGQRLNELSALLTKEEIIAGILSTLNSPVSGIVGSINAVIRDLASVIEEAVKKKAA